MHNSVDSVAKTGKPKYGKEERLIVCCKRNSPEEEPYVRLGKTEVVGEKHYTVWVVDGWMSVEQWWNGTDRGKLKCWEKSIIQCGW